MDSQKKSFLKTNWLRIFLVLLVAGLIIAFFALDLNQYLTLSYLKQTRDKLQLLYAQNTLLVLGAYFLIYILSAALSLPGAAVLSLAGAALFGFWKTLVAVSFASTIGATLAFLFARYLLRDWVQNKFSKRLDRINQGVEQEGAFYLFTLRLIPVFPFWVINLVMALTPLKTSTFYWVSQLGMLPGTAVYVNAGKQLGTIDSLGEIFTLNIIFSFALLGLFPLIVKKAMEFYRKRTGKAKSPI
jgi:uncharacterized membrane protein YdjX (TVP38/TMEM64 family)